MKTFYEQDNIGSARYTVSFHDGTKTHKDGSPFYDIQLFRNKVARDKFVRELERQGFTRK